MADVGLTTATEAQAQTREIESTTESTNVVLDYAEEINNRLRRMKSRLLGSDEAKSEESNAPEPVRSEIQELQYRIHQVNLALNETASLVGDLERI